MLGSLDTRSPIRLTGAEKMPKQKTHKGTKKRFRLTATGKAKHRQAGTSHLATRMSQKRKRNLRGTTTVAKCMEKSIRMALGGYSD
jgi:large subunit ribosomal protein L35